MTFATHAEFEQQHPSYAEHARAMEARRVDRGLEPERSFPCYGVLNQTDEAHGVATLCCSQCGFEITVPVPSGRRETEEATW